MSALRKKVPYSFPSEHHSKAENQASLRKAKLTAETISEKLRTSVIDNPKTAQKAALLISLWLDGKTPKSKKLKP